MIMESKIIGRTQEIEELNSLYTSGKPEFVAISCGNGNEYGHPAQETLDRLKAHTNQIYVTMKCSSIAFLYEADTKRKYILNWNQVKVSDDEIQR